MKTLSRFQPTNVTRRSFLVGASSMTAAAMLPIARPARAAQQLRIGLSAYPANFGPWNYLGTAAETVKLQSFRGLVSYAHDGTIRPELAESWEMDGDRTYIFRMRPGAKFHNGDPVDAAEVKYSFERMGAPDSTAFLKSFFSSIESIEAVDSMTVRMTLAEPNAIALDTLASYDAPLVSRRSLEQDPDNPVGAGPYVITGMERGSWIDLEAFPEFYRPGLPKTKSLRFAVYADENARVAALQAGDVDLIEYVPAFSMQSIRDDSRFILDSVEGPATVVIFNCQEGPFVDARVRRAVGYAIDRQAVIDGAFAGEGAKCGPLPISRSSPFFDPELVDYFERDLDKARQLLQEAGVGGGFNTTLLATSQYSVHRDPAMVIQQNLAEIGINAELNLPDWPTRVQLGNQGQYHISVSATAMDMNDPAALSGLISGELPPSFSRAFGYKNETVEALLDKGRSTLDEAARKSIYAELGRAFVEDPGVIGVVFRYQAYARKAGVDGFANLPGFATYGSGITIEDISIA